MGDVVEVEFLNLTLKDFIHSLKTSVKFMDKFYFFFNLIQRFSVTPELFGCFVVQIVNLFLYGAASTLYVAKFGHQF